MLYPERCPICDNVLAIGGEAVCKECLGEIELVGEPRCKKCGKPLLEEEELCMDCQNKESSYEYGYGLFVYNSSMRESVGRFKYQGRQEYAVFYAREMFREYGQWLAEKKPQALIPVPIHRRRYRSRGYNQAELIADELGKLAGISVRKDILVRCKDTLPQKELSELERKHNLQGAFRVDGQGEELNQLPKCVIIIDDIYTTGCTLESCSSVLKEAGISEIYFLCVCIGKGY